MDNEALTGRIIGAAIEVHRALGPGFLEAIYEEALAVELDHCGIRYERQKPVSICYRGRKVGEHRLDFLVEEVVVVELKAIQALDNVHFAIVRSYLKSLGLATGLLLNFATMPLMVKRVGREDSARLQPLHDAPLSSFPDFLSS